MVEIKAAQPATSTDGIQFQETIPILRIFSIEKAKEFYVDFLGFSIDWEHRFGDNFPLYAQVSRAGLKLHLSEHHGDASPGSTVFIWMRGIAEYHRELIGKDYRYNKPGLEDAPWDAKVMEVSDPFGNKLRFSERNEPDPHD
jgi:catechol 2,3-dioxygenase-like lactoylglutathione lyase family enzyme